MDDTGDRAVKVVKRCNIAAGVVDAPAVDSESYVSGGILSNPKLSWISSGPRLTAINNDDGSKRTGWTFGWALGDPSYRVVCVEELEMSNNSSPILIVACESELNGNSLCFYHSGSSRVLKSIHFNEKISSLEVVSNRNHQEENLTTLLKSWNGVLAVGMGSGKVYLLDLWWKGLQSCIEDHRQKLYDEQRQSKIVEIAVQDLLDNVDIKTSNVRHGSSTLTLWLNEETLKKGRSSSHPGVENILGRMPQEFLTVSALKYFPQIGCLAVGYNTSCFQLWDLTSLNILYTSALLETMLPVYSFSLLEPSDDPRFVCYLWSFHHSVDEDSIPFAGMYILNYHEKHVNDFTMQPFYEGFSSCTIRYQLDLGAEIDNVVSGRIISSQAIQRSNVKPSHGWAHSENEDTGVEESTTSLLMITWEVWTPHQLNTFTRLTLFDLNQWYREYMPHSSETEYSHFMTHFCLPESSPLDVHVVPNSVRQFATLHPVDEHFYPSAFSFECVCLHETQVMVCSHTGTQLECLQLLREGGPSALLLPSRLYKMCTLAGIRPLLHDSTMSSPNTLHAKEQREYLLSIALELDMVQFLRNCVRDWSDGSHAVAGCTLPSLLHWAWARVQAYKKWLDRLCVPLFDYSGTTLDSNDSGVFHHMVCQLHRLHDLFKLVLKKYRNCILPGSFEQQQIAISLVAAFYDAVLWCVKNRVLPETNAGDANAKSFLPYLYDQITNSTISRRAELHQVARSMNVSVPVNGLLLIDSLITEEGGGSRLTDQWEREGGSVTVGKYPPPSIQSLLRTFLVRGITSHIKHTIVTYFLHDLVFTLGPNSMSDSTRQRVLDYPSDFGLTVSQTLIAKAFWCLDHQKYEEGVSLLLDAGVDKADLQVYQHHTILCLLISASEHRLALHYLNVRKPCLPEHQDIKIKMTLLLVNNLIHEAFQFQRHHHTMKTELMEQFFKGCVEMKKLDVVFKLPLNAEEEEALMMYLDACSLPQADDLRVYYLILRSRYLEAIDMNEKLRYHSKNRRIGANNSLPLGFSPLGPRQRNIFGAKDDSGAPAKTVLTTRDLIINSVAKNLPSVTKELADYCNKEKKFNWKQLNRPTPLSVEVHTELSNERLPFYKSADTMLMQAALKKTRETWAHLLATPVVQKRKLCSLVEDAPFLRTPRLDPSLSNASQLSMLRSGGKWGAEEGKEEPVAIKRARLEFSPERHAEEATRTQVTSYKALDMEMTESAALLHTPLVTRAVKVHSRGTGTPHSILKGSAANTPTTPGRGDKTLFSASISRQIRFSLPGDTTPSPSKTTISMDEEQDDSFTPKLSPRKSIHEISSVQERKGTPANPRLSRHSVSLRSVATNLQFEDEAAGEEEEVPKPRLSATAAALLKNISASSVSSDDTFLSLRSSPSSKSGKSRDSGVSFKLALGIEGNIPASEACDETLLDSDSSHSFISTAQSEKSNSSQDEINKTLRNDDHISNEENKADTSNVKSRDSSLSCKSTLEQIRTETDTEFVQNQEASHSFNSTGLCKKQNLTSGSINETIQSNMYEVNTNEENHVKCNQLEKLDLVNTSKQNHTNSFHTNHKKPLSEENDPQSPHYKNIVVKFTSPSPFLKKNKSNCTDANNSHNSTHNSYAEDSEEESFKKPVFKWTVVKDQSSKESLKLEVCKKDKDVEKCIATVAVSQEMLLYSCDAKESQVRSNSKPVTNDMKNCDASLPLSVEHDKTSVDDKNKQSLQLSLNKATSLNVSLESATSTLSEESFTENKFEDWENTKAVFSSTFINNSKTCESLETTERKDEVGIEEQPKSSISSLHSTTKIGDIPLEQVLEELIRKKKICSVVKETTVQEEKSSVDVEEHLTEDNKLSNELSKTGREEDQEILWDGGLEEDIHLSYHDSTYHPDDSKISSQEDVSTNLPSDQKSVENVENLDTNRFEAKDSTNIILEEVQEEDVEPSLEKDTNLQGEESSEVPSFIITSTKSITSTSFALENESVGDFELRMSEGESGQSVAEIDEDIPGEVESSDKVVGETCAAVEEEIIEEEAELQPSVEEEVIAEDTEHQPTYQTLTSVQFEDGHQENLAHYEEEYNEGEENEAAGTGDEEVDIYGGLEGDSTSPKSNKNEDSEEEVICLESSSEDEDVKQALLKCNTLKRLHEADLKDESLDYEDDDGDENKEDSSLSDSTEKEYSSDESSQAEHSESDNEDYRGNRSWKEEKTRVRDENSTDGDSYVHDENSVDSIESPPYELLSQGESQDQNISTSKQQPQSTTSDDPNLDTNSSNALESNINVDQSSYQETLEEKISEKTASTESINIEESSKESEVIDVVKFNDEHSKEGQDEEKVDVADDYCDKKIDEAVTELQLALDKRMKTIETGSLTELKKQRIKRFNSIQNLSQSSKKKLRRRSLSHHDLTSMRIVEEKSTRPVNQEVESLETCDQPPSQSQDERASSPEPFVDTGSQVLNTEKQIDLTKRQRLFLKNRTTSLQDITEELESSRNSLERANKLRKSLSTSALNEQVDISISQPLSPTPTTDLVNTLVKDTNISILNEEREDSVSENKEILNSPHSEMEPSCKTDEMLKTTIDSDQCKEFEGYTSGNKDDQSQIEIKVTTPPHQNTSLNLTPVRVSQSIKTVNVIQDSPASRTRRKRAMSESFTIPDDTLKMSSRRRSSSLMKIQAVEKRVLPRHSYNRYSHKVSIQPMEILNSDDESFCETTPMDEENDNVPQPSSSSMNIEVVPHQSSSLGESSYIHPSEPLKDSIVEENSVHEDKGRRATSEPPCVEKVTFKKVPIRKSASYYKMQKLHKMVLGRASLRKSLASRVQQVGLEVIQSSDDEKSFHKDSPLPHSTSEAIHYSNETGESCKSVDNKPDCDSNKALDEPMNVPKKKGAKAKKTKYNFSKGQEKNQDSESNRSPSSASEPFPITETPRNTKAKIPKKPKSSELHDDTASTHEKDDMSTPEDENAIAHEKPVPKRGKRAQTKKEPSEDSSVKEGTKNKSPSRKITNRKIKKTNIPENESEKTEPSESNKKRRKVLSKPSPSSDSAKEASPKNTNSSPETSLSGVKEKLKNPLKRVIQETVVLDSPARRTRRSMSRMSSDFEMLTPTSETTSRKRTKKGAASDVGSMPPQTSNEYAESEASEASTTASSRLNTPTRRSQRLHSLTNTPTTPDVNAEEHLLQRRLTRNQHLQIKRHLEMSLTESPRLEDLPEEDEEEESAPVSTPKAKASTKRVKSKTQKK